MHTIQMVDLKGQYQKIKSEVDEEIEKVILSTAFINGPQVGFFEDSLKKYLSTNFLTTCGNGTDALQIAMMALDLKPGDKVITPTFTYIATLEAAAILGLVPVFVDACPKTFNIDIEKLKNIALKGVKCIIPVHLYGQCSEMSTINDFAQANNLFVIEDTAQALGSEYSSGNTSIKKAGTIGHVGTTSFFPSKNLGCFGDGGALFTNDASIGEKVKMICNHGQKQKYYHDIIGMNSRLDTLQASILNVKLKKLDTYIAARQKAASFYDNAFQNHPNISTPFRASYSSHSFHQYTIILKNADRNELKTFLASKGIPTMVYYPLPAHLQKGYQYLGYKKGDFPVAESLSNNVLSLPIHTELDNEQLEYITQNLLSFFK